MFTLLSGRFVADSYHSIASGSGASTSHVYQAAESSFDSQPHVYTDIATGNEAQVVQGSNYNESVASSSIQHASNVSMQITLSFQFLIFIKSYKCMEIKEDYRKNY